MLVVNDPDPEESDKDADKGKDKNKESGSKKAKPPIVIDRYQFKTDESGYLGKQRSHLMLFDVAGRRAESLTSGDSDELLPAWSPDGKTIAFVSKRGPDSDRTDVWQIYAIEPRAGAAPRQLTTETVSSNQPDWESSLDWSPDSKWIAFVQGGPDKLIYYGLHKLAVVPAGGGAARVLTPELDRNVQSPRFSEDGKSILFTLEEDQAVFLARIPAAGGKIDRLVTSRGCVLPVLTARGGKTAILHSSVSKPAEVYVLGPGAGEPRALTHQNDAWIAELKLAPVEETKFQSKDGTAISGFLVKPVDYVPGKLYPTILRIHGGPVGQWECSFEEDFQWFAANGYAVVAANPRGSSGKGEKFQAAIFADWGPRGRRGRARGGGRRDRAEDRGSGPPGRRGLELRRHDDQLRHRVDEALQGRDGGRRSANALAGYGTDSTFESTSRSWGSREAHGELAQGVVPVLHADRISTPTLFLCGDKDFNVPSDQLGADVPGAPQPRRAHRARHLPGPAPRDPQAELRARPLERYVAWYDKYAKGGGAGGGTTTAMQQGAAR